MRLSDPHIEAQATARLGKTFKGKWHLDELVGYGGVAAVYAATHRNRSRVAVKVLHNELAAIPTLRDRFMVRDMPQTPWITPASCVSSTTTSARRGRPSS